MSVTVHDQRPCQLGEGALWHPEVKCLYWFDILGKKLLRDDGREWDFGRCVSAAGWIDDTRLLVASETGLGVFDTQTGQEDAVCELESDNSGTRSNDGRADPYGGFWIGTMGKHAEPGKGAIYRYYRGEIRKIFAPVSIPNAICFSPDGETAYFADSARAIVFRVALRRDDGWPDGTPETFLDLASAHLTPDGAVIATDGSFVNAQWGAARIACYDPTGAFVTSFALPTDHVTCPAFGGEGLSRLFVTSARQGLSAEQLAMQPQAGQVFTLEIGLQGMPEPQVVL